MNHVSPSVRIEALLAVERVLVPQPDDVCRRVLRRARASVPRSLYAHRSVQSPGSPRRLAVGQLVAAAVLLSSLCSAAFYAGYRLRSSDELVPASVHAAKRAAAVKSNALALSATAVPVLPSCTALAAAAPEAPLSPKLKPSPEARSESDAYALELQVLQPAQRAVARRDYASALAAIAAHRRQFPAGRLAEEREALRVKALLGLGRATEAERAGGAFREQFPHSALRGRMDEMLEAQR